MKISIKKLVIPILTGILLICIAPVTQANAENGAAEEVPIASIEFEPVRIAQWTNGHFCLCDENNEKKDWYRYYIYNDNYTVKFSDGTPDIIHTEKDEESGFYYKDEYIDVNCTIEQDEFNELQPGVHTVNVFAEDYETTYEFEIVQIPIASMEFDSMTVIERTNLHGTFYPNGDFAYTYDDYNDSYVIRFSDGTPNNYYASNDGVSWGFKYDDLEVDLNFHSYQDEENPWQIGTHEVLVRAGGYSTTYDYTIIPTPVSAIKHDPIFVAENTCGDIYTHTNDDGEEIEYYIYNPEEFFSKYTATINGIDIESDEAGYIYYDAEGYSPWLFFENQSIENQWTIGNTYPVTVWIMGYVHTFDVTIVSHIHTWDNGTITKTPNCISTGIKTYRCLYKECNEIKEELLKISPDNHKERILSEKDPTCSKTGLTEGKQCADCGLILVEQKIIPMAEHEEIKLDKLSATCTRNGLTAGKQCAKCGRVTISQSEIPALGHKLETLKAKAATCTKTGLTSGKKCKVCGTITKKQKKVEKRPHVAKKKTIKQATGKKNGSITKRCNCGAVVSIEKIKRVRTIKLAQSVYIYNGKKKTPKIIVEDSDGKTLKKNKDYTVVQPKGRKQIGTYTYKVVLKGNYKGTKNLKLTIKELKTPSTPAIRKISSKKKSVTIKWNATDNAAGYYVYARTGKKGAYKKVRTIYDQWTTSFTHRNLKRGMSYFYKVQAFNIKDGVTKKSKSSTFVAIVAR